MESGKPVYRSRRGSGPKYIAPASLALVIAISAMFGSAAGMIVGVLGLLWWTNTFHGPNLLRMHKETIDTETLDSHGQQYPLRDMDTLQTARFHLLRFGMPQVRQVVTLLRTETSAPEPYLLITSVEGRTTIHPIISR